eukprot:gene39416-32233_t
MDDDIVTLAKDGTMTVWERTGGEKDMIVARTNLDMEFPGSADVEVTGVYITPDGSLVAVTTDAAPFNPDFAQEMNVSPPG